MADRTVYGHDFSENGWRMVDQGSCQWITVPGTNVHLEIREGQPAEILGAWAADFNAYVQPLRDADSACWTAGNSVGTSNHLSGSALDLDWDDHPMGNQYAGFSQTQVATIREMLDFYENTVFWGNDWNSPHDSMHFQMGYDTYGAQNVDRVQGFINRKIRADGYSTFRRGGVIAPAPLSRADGYAVQIIDEGRRRNVTPRGIQIALSVALVESGLKIYANSNVPESMNIPHDAVGTDHDSVGLFQQRCPMWGPAAVLMNPAQSAGLFYDRLVKLNYNDPNRQPGDFAADVQRPAAQYRGRYQERMGDAVALYNRLDTTAPGDDMAAVPQEQWDRVYHELVDLRQSRSPLRHLGEGKTDTWSGFGLNTDGSEHLQIVKLLAGYGHPPTLALLREVAGADPQRYPDRQDDRLIAQAILAELGTPKARTLVSEAPAPQAVAEPQVVYAPATSEGQRLGAAFDALAALRLDEQLPPAAKAPLDALLGVLQARSAA